MGINYVMRMYGGYKGIRGNKAKPKGKISMYIIFSTFSSGTLVNVPIIISSSSIKISQEKKSSEMPLTLRAFWEIMETSGAFL